MNSTYSINNSHDLYKKLEIDYTVLEEEVNAYSVFNFVVTAFHLHEWIQKDNNISKVKKRFLSKTIINSDEFKICADLANSSKHFNRKIGNNKIVNKTEMKKGYGIGRYGKGAYGIGEESIVIQLMLRKRIFTLN